MGKNREADSSCEQLSHGPVVEGSRIVNERANLHEACHLVAGCIPVMSLRPILIGIADRSPIAIIIATLHSRVLDGPEF